MVKPEGPANWKIPVGELSAEECEQRWCWLTAQEEQRFEDLADYDEEAYMELVATIEAATAGLLPVDDTHVSLVNHPLNKNMSKKWGGAEVPWVGEWKTDSTIEEYACYRVYFTDALEKHEAVSHQMIGLIFRKYPDKRKKKDSQSRDIDIAIVLAKKHQRKHSCVLRTMRFARA